MTRMWKLTTVWCSWGGAKCVNVVAPNAKAAIEKSKLRLHKIDKVELVGDTDE